VPAAARRILRTATTLQPLPIDEILPDLRRVLTDSAVLALSAEPGAGKTTRVPPSLLSEPWLAGKKILMLEPRRLAASRSALYMAAQAGESVGQSIGYRIRGETRVGPGTRIEVVTEGILTRFLHADPALTDYGVIIFDEFHERSIHADLGLALTLDVQRHLRPDLRIIVMSATLDLQAVAALLGNAPVLESKGRAFPVVTHYLPQKLAEPIEQQVAGRIVRALQSDEGDILVFLPGQREIRRVGELLQAKYLGDVAEIRALYGEASAAEQRSALSPLANKKKVILSTSIAETSLTIDGVRVVIDAGLSRVPRFDPRRGMSGLVTVPVSRANADQRRGRAGRQAPGICYRLYTEQDHRELPQASQPEIVVSDLASLALDFAMWGTPAGEGLSFLDPPPPAHLAQAQDLLRRLSAIDEHGQLTQHGRAIAALPVHPRLGHMLLRGKDLGVAPLACDIAALLEERDLLRGVPGTDIDLRSRWLELRRTGKNTAPLIDRIRREADLLKTFVGVAGEQHRENQIGVLLALAYPERVARRREGENKRRYQTAGGSGAIVPAGSALAREPYLAIGETDGSGEEVKIFLAEPLEEQSIRLLFADQIVMAEEVWWDEQTESVIARRFERFGAITLASKPLPASDERIQPAFIQGIRRMGPDCLPLTDTAESFIRRSEWVRLNNLAGSGWPHCSVDHLMETVEEWLGPYIGGMTRRQQLAGVDLLSALRNRLTHRQIGQLDELAPTHLTAPTGSHIPLMYRADGAPVLAVRIQEMFGQTATPLVGGGKIAVVLHLLSPARRPLAVTGDLPSFWKNSYPEVRKTMRGRYPKHFWPENPLEAEPTRRTKRRPS
jgi:ATP-dependent helicase HrpB